jgi:hypothetical protein
MVTRLCPVALLLSLVAPPVCAADLAGPPPVVEERSQGLVVCPLWQPPYGIRLVPTNDACDPTYVGSSMGLSRPSYYGTLPPPGYDAP